MPVRLYKSLERLRKPSTFSLRIGSRDYDPETGIWNNAHSLVTCLAMALNMARTSDSADVMVALDAEVIGEYPDNFVEMFKEVVQEILNEFQLAKEVLTVDFKRVGPHNLAKLTLMATSS